MRQIVINLDSRDRYLLYQEVIRQGENLGAEIVVNLNAEFAGYRYLMRLKLNNNDTVPTAELPVVNNQVRYPIPALFTVQAGELKIVFEAFEQISEGNNRVIKSATTILKVIESLDGGTEIMPEPYVPWYLEAVEAAAEASISAEEATDQATIATTQAGIATTKAQEAAQSVIDASTAGEEAAQNVVDNLTSRVAALESSKIKKYGVKFTGSNPIGERLYDAVGMVANVAVNNQIVVNDFDKVSFFDRPMCNVYFDSLGNPTVMAYRGEPGFNMEGAIFPPYAEKAEVYYECSPCAWNGSYDEPTVTGTPAEGFELFSCFPNWNTKIYLPTFWMAFVDGKPTSRSGVRPGYYSLNSAMSEAKAWNVNAHVETMAAHMYEYILQLVEFATRDLQNIMMGCSNLRYNSATDTAVIAETSVNRIIVTNSTASNYVVGQTIVIGTAQNGTNVAAERSITAIETYDADNKALVFDGNPVNIAIGNFISSRAWKNGITDIVRASSGSPVSNTSGKYPCIWRGKVDPWAHSYSVICDILIQRRGVGTTEEPYTYRPYYLPDPRKYANGVITSDYIELQYDLPQADGYAKSLWQDSRYRFIGLTNELGASSTTYLAAYYYRPQYDVCLVFVGGNFLGGRSCSPVYFYCNYPPSHSTLSRLARLFVSRV